MYHLPGTIKSSIYNEIYDNGTDTQYLGHTVTQVDMIEWDGIWMVYINKTIKANDMIKSP